MPDEWMTYDELAARVGIGREAARVMARRRKWARRVGNDGRAQIRVDSEALNAPTSGGRPPLSRADASPGADIESGERPPLSRADDVQGVRAQYEAEIARMETRHAAEIERLIGQTHAERTFWIERADAAEVRAEQADDRAAEMATRLADISERSAQGPWWRRLLG